MRHYQFFVYILASRFRTLYVGMTNDLGRRLAEHRERPSGSFTARYRVTRLVHLEEFGDVRAAIAREKQVKGWIRAKKLKLIEASNPEWKDLGDPS